MLCTDRGILGRTLDGGFQGYVNVPVENCYPVLAKVPHEVLALAEPLTVAMHAVNRGRFRNGEVALVVGGGAIGLLTAMVLMRRGAGQVGVVEPVAARRKLAEELGVTFTIDPNEGRVIEEVFARASGIGADIVLECVGSAQTYQLSLNLARKQGRIVIVGGSPEPTPINFRDFLRSEKEIIGSFGRFDEWEESISLLGKEPWIWQRLINKLPLEEAPNAFQMLRTQPQGQAGYVKVIIFSA
jgi:threonine dehydrogenase-like Zn-dependent dehydrogenase